MADAQAIDACRTRAGRARRDFCAVLSPEDHGCDGNAKEQIVSHCGAGITLAFPLMVTQRLSIRIPVADVGAAGARRRSVGSSHENADAGRPRLAWRATWQDHHAARAAFIDGAALALLRLKRPQFRRARFAFLIRRGANPMNETGCTSHHSALRSRRHRLNYCYRAILQGQCSLGPPAAMRVANDPAVTRSEQPETQYSDYEERVGVCCA